MIPPELLEAHRELYLSHDFWIGMLPTIAVALITWTFIFLYTILEAVKDFRNS